ncbi:hypothetical protein PC116_g32026 [Phytophthora cactorum]|nr:hypothetical protein PC116_g32026 [Phytophthora cactorum]
MPLAQVLSILCLGLGALGQIRECSTRNDCPGTKVCQRTWNDSKLNQLGPLQYHGMEHQVETDLFEDKTCQYYESWICTEPSDPACNNGVQDECYHSCDK